jgi:hypothetical protein
MHSLNHGKSSINVGVIFIIFKKLPKVNNSSMDEKFPNLGTLMVYLQM